MKKSLRQDNRGMAHLAAIIVVVVVIVIAGAGYLVYKNRQNNSSSTAPAATTGAASKQITDACTTLYNDKDLCKFAANYNISGNYKATFTMTDKDGKTTNFETSVDGKQNSSSVTKDNGKEASAFISLNGDTYLKDETDGSWTKYPKSPDTTQTSNPTSDLKVDFKDESSKPEASRITYKKLGKESCGNLTCFKYQVIDPSQPGTTSIIWFGTKDYVLHKWSFTDKDGSKSVGEFTFASVTISAPSPVKAAPSTPSASDLQKMIDQAQAQSQADSSNQ